MMQTERFQQLQTAAIKADNDWRTIVGNPYLAAYATAYRAYQKTLDKQNEADKEAGELFVTAACVVTGSVLLGSIGSASIRMIAMLWVITVARARLTDNMFRLFRSVRKNDAVVFAVGALVDKLKDNAKKKASSIVQDYLKKTSVIVTPEPLVQFLQLDSFMRANINCALDMAQMIDDEPSLNETAKEDAYNDLRAAPFFNTPVRRSPPFPASLAEIIELTFYLSAMLESDSLESVSAGAVTEYGSTAKSTSAPILQRPLAPDYPHPPRPAMPSGNWQPAYQNVAIDRAGGTVQKRTNELCSKVLGETIYSSTFFGMGGPADTEKAKELQAADRLLEKIAVKMKPLNPVEAIG